MVFPFRGLPESYFNQIKTKYGEFSAKPQGQSKSIVSCRKAKTTLTIIGCYFEKRYAPDGVISVIYNPRRQNKYAEISNLAAAIILT